MSLSEHASSRARRAAFRRLDDSFPVNRGLRPVFLMMANAHRHAIDYLDQAPVIVAAVTRGRTHVVSSEFAFLQEQFAGLCESAARLRDVMELYGLPVPLRKLQAGVLTAARATVVRRLALMNPSTLSQVIPPSRQKQNAWLHGLELWVDAMARRSDGGLDRCPFFEWAAVNLAGVTYREAEGATHLVDYVAHHLATFNPRWTLAQAHRREQAWHEELALAELDDGPGVEPETPIDYGPLPCSWEGDGYRFVALQTGRDLHLEGAAMHHCVSSYWQHVIRGRSRIYSIRSDGTRVATLELCDRPESYRWGKGEFRVRQLVGFRNSRPAPEVTKAVSAFVDQVNKGAAIAA